MNRRRGNAPRRVGLPLREGEARVGSEIKLNFASVKGNCTARPEVLDRASTEDAQNEKRSTLTSCALLYRGQPGRCARVGARDSRGLLCVLLERDEKARSASGDRSIVDWKRSRRAASMRAWQGTAV